MCFVVVLEVYIGLDLYEMALFKTVRRCFATNQVIDNLKFARSGGFNNVLSKMNILKAHDGNCIAELNLEEEHLNSMQQLHPGLSVTLMDVIATCASMSHEKGNLKFGVSVNMHFAFHKTASLGDTIIIDAKVLHLDNVLGFQECEIRNKVTGDLLVKGSPTTFLIPSVVS